MANPKLKDDDSLLNQSAEEKGIGISEDSFDEKPRSMPRSVKLLIGTAVGLVLLAGGAGLVATQVIDQQKYKELAVSKVKEATGYSIDWKGNISLGLMPLPHASVSELTVKNGDAQILSVAKADVQVALSPLLSKKIEIKSVTIDEPVVTLTTAKDGRQLWVANKSAATTAETASSDEAEQSAPMDITVNRIDIVNGSFIADNQQSKSKQELEKLNLSLRAGSLTGPFDISGSTDWAGKKIEVTATSGEVNPNEGRYPIQAGISLPDIGTKLDFTGTVDTNNKAADGDIKLEAGDLASVINGLSGSKPDLPKGLDGQARLAGKIVYSSNRVALDEMSMALGSVGFTGAVSVDGLNDGQQPQLSFNLTPKSKAAADAAPLVQILSELTMKAKGTMENDKIQIAQAEIKTKGTDIAFTGYATTGASPNVNLNVTASEINLDSLSQKMAAKGDGKESGGTASSSAKSDIGFTLPFTGQVRTDIAKLTTGGKTYSNVKADITSNNGALSIATASLALPEGASVEVKGKIGSTQEMSGLDLNLAANTNDVEKLAAAYGADLPDAAKNLGAVGVNGHFTGDLKNLGFSSTVSAKQFNVSGAGTVGDPLGTPVINSLKFAVKHPNFNDALKTLQPGFSGSSGFSGALDLSGELEWGDSQYTLSNLGGKLGQTTVAGNMFIKTGDKMALSGALDIGNIVLPSATSGNAGGGTATAAAPSSGGARWSRDAIDTAWMRSFDADLKIKAKSITQNMWKLSDANFAFVLKDGTLTIDDVSAGLFGGKAAVSGVVKSGAAAGDPLTINAKMNASNVDAQGLMSAATGKISHTLTGTISDMNVTINATGASPSALVQTLAGSGAMNGKNIIVQGVDAAQLAAAAKGSYKPLERAGSLFQSFQGGSTEFTDFNSEFAIQNGIVNFSKIYFDGPKATLNSTGNVNLPLWTVDLKNTMTVKDTDIPPFDFTVRGPLDNPMNSGGDVINNYLQNKLEKKATKLIEDKLKGKLGDKLNQFLGTGTGSGASATPTDSTTATPSTADAPVAPAATDATVAPTEVTPQPAQQQVDPNKAAAQQAVKALQGLLGQ